MMNIRNMAEFYVQMKGKTRIASSEISTTGLRQEWRGHLRRSSIASDYEKLDQFGRPDGLLPNPERTQFSYSGLLDDRICLCCTWNEHLGRMA